MSGDATGPRGLRREMFALSFTALFLEMLVIRWVPSVVHLVAYYANLMLLSSFLGLGAGAIASARKGSLLGWFPAFLACDIGMLLLDRNVFLGSTSGELRFYTSSASAFHAVILTGIFGFNALIFVPLGQRMGVLFRALPRLSAYAWDLGGSLCGTLCFGLFSLRLFSPVAGMAFVMCVYLGITRGRRWLLDVAVFAGVLGAIVWNSDPRAIWSPYYYVTVSDVNSPTVSVAAPPPGLMTMRDPPIYAVKVNQFGYHLDAALDTARYTPGSGLEAYARLYIAQYLVPYEVSKGRDRVMVVGAGGGFDVEAALLSGARHVDAVEIDPVIVGVSRRFNAGAPYFDPRVSVHVDDGRSYMAKATPGYDLVAFGYLDSQALFSTMSNVRLDGYIYTVESIRSAFRLLNDHGMLSLNFTVGTKWLPMKLYETVAKATGRPPAMYYDRIGSQLILCAPKDPRQAMPVSLGRFVRASFTDPPRMDLPTDDWPFLYLSSRTIPSDYLAAIVAMLAFSVGTVGFLRGRSLGWSDAHFGLLGLGFLLLETKSISDASLFFGATWFVTLVVVSGVLLMVIAANLVAERLKAPSPWMYAPLFAALALLILVPREHILAYGMAGRLLWTVAAVPLPVFFAGIVFSTTFRGTASPSAAFGANLIGAMVGGFCEYLSMAIGNHRLSALVAAAYLGSLLVVLTSRRRGVAI